jgi:hypothetical protein
MIEVVLGRSVLQVCQEQADARGGDHKALTAETAKVEAERLS